MSNLFLDWVPETQGLGLHCVHSSHVQSTKIYVAVQKSAKLYLTENLEAAAFNIALALASW